MLDRDWLPIADAPRNGTLVEVLVPRRVGGFIEGRAYFDPAAYDGTWWWEHTSRAAYHDSSIEDGNDGPPACWRACPPVDAPAEWLARRFYQERPASYDGQLSWTDALREAAPYVADLRRFAQLAIGVLRSVKR